MVDAGNILAGILGGALGDIEGAEAVKEMARKEAREDEVQRAGEMAIVAAALDNEAGRKFVEWLALKTVLRSPNDGELAATTAEAAAIASQRRIGQNQIFFLLVEVLNQARAVRGKPDAQQSKGRKA